MKFGKYILILSAMALGLSGCLRDDNMECPVVPGGQAQFTVSMNVPGTLDVQTRASAETKIKTLDLLIFSSTGKTDQNEMFVERKQLSSTDINSGSDFYNFKVSFAAATGTKYRLVLLANSRAGVNAATLIGKTKNEILSSISFDIIDVLTQVSILQGNYPMWGETEEVYTLSDNVSIPTIQMLRSLASVQVNLAENVRPTFSMHEIRVHNYNNKGYVAPGAGKYSHATRSVNGVTVFQSPSSEPMTLGVNGADASSGSLYFTECDNVGANNEFAIIVRATYTFGGRTYPDLYYKVLLRDKNGNRIDVLRNHEYSVTITDVAGPGYATEQEALDDNNNNTYIQAEVVDWNDANQNIVIDGNHYLRVSQPGLELYQEGGGIWIDIETNHPDGITMDWAGSSIDFMMITCPALTGYGVEGDQKLHWHFGWSDFNVAGTERTGWLNIKAGNLTYKFNIKQVKQPWLTFQAEPVSLLDGYYHSVAVNSEVPWVANSYDAGTADWVGDYFRFITTSSAESKNYLYYMVEKETDHTLDHLDKITLVVESDGPYRYPAKEIPLWLTSGTLMPESNCYLVEPDADKNTALVMMARDLESANSGWTWGDDDTAGAKLVWTDCSTQANNPNGVVASALGGGNGKNVFLRVRIGDHPGNTVVGITNSDVNEIFWSWHIWSTPDRALIEQGISGVGGKLWMDRSLGAMGTFTSVDGSGRPSAPSHPGSTSGSDTDAYLYGLYYQTGRKDPIPANGRDYWHFSYNSFGDELVTKNYPINTRSVAGSGSGITLFETTLNDPFVVLTDNYLEWMRPWMDSRGEPTMHDPCPVGWRVASEDEYGHTPYVGNVPFFYSGEWGLSSVTSNGFTMNNHGRYYHLQGMRSSADPSTIVGLGEKVEFWCAETGWTSNLFFTSKFFVERILSSSPELQAQYNMNNDSSEYYALRNVRCVKK